MLKGLLGKKIGMTGMFRPDGSYIPVTVIKVGPCVVTQIKTTEIDGYTSVQLGFEEKKTKNVTKPLLGHFKKSGGKSFAHLKEFRTEQVVDFTLGQEVKADLFSIGERVDISGYSKGRGFAGVVKRHGFAGGPETHGCRSHRVPGSVGCSAWPAKIIKGKKMPGHYGVERITVRNLEVIDIRTDENLILVKGAVPGARSALIEINKIKFAK